MRSRADPSIGVSSHIVTDATNGLADQWEWTPLTSDKVHVMVCHGMVWYGIDRGHVMVYYSMVWYGMACYGIV